MDRLACNLEDLRRLVRRLTDKKVRVEFVKEQLTFTGEDSAMANLLLNMMGAFAEFERELILERQREGIALAKQRGVYRERTRSLTAAQVEELRAQVAAGVPKSVLAREFGVSRETVYAYLRAERAPVRPVSEAPAPDVTTGQEFADHTERDNSGDDPQDRLVATPLRPATPYQERGPAKGVENHRPRT